MYKWDLALNNQQELICHKIQPIECMFLHSFKYSMYKCIHFVFLSILFSVNILWLY